MLHLAQVLEWAPHSGAMTLHARWGMQDTRGLKHGTQEKHGAQGAWSSHVEPKPCMGDWAEVALGPKGPILACTVQSTQDGPTILYLAHRTKSLSIIGLDYNWWVFVWEEMQVKIFKYDSECLIPQKNLIFRKPWAPSPWSWGFFSLTDESKPLYIKLFGCKITCSTSSEVCPYSKAAVNYWMRVLLIL